MADKEKHVVSFPRSGLSIENELRLNLPAAVLVEEALKNHEGVLASTGALLVETGEYTGRSPNDKYIVDYDGSDDHEIEWGNVNKALSPAKFNNILRKVTDYIRTSKMFVQDLKAGNHPDHYRSFRVITEKAWAALFALDLLLPSEIVPTEEPDFTLVHVPNFKADPSVDGTNSKAFILLDFHQKLVLIGGTSYAGEIKKAIFSVMNRILPAENVLPMHCSANIGHSGDTALFFGLSGTGKTSLSSSADRFLIGDDEHGWGDDGVFNFEGGCYAKTIHLKRELEPMIWDASQRFGSVLENVAFDEKTRIIDFDNDHKTENTRAAYPLNFIEGHVETGRGGHPRNIFFLSADAFGVLPPISWLTDEQASYFYLLGYTAKLAGTEKGLGKEPEATFSTFFGEPFLPLSPDVYGKLFLGKIRQYKPKVWLINTGWTGGPYGTGHRIDLPHSRAMINWALKDGDEPSGFHKDGYFDLRIPDHITGIPDDLLDPVKTWSDVGSYSKTAKDLIKKMSARMMEFEGKIEPEILNGGPKIAG